MKSPFERLTSGSRCAAGSMTYMLRGTSLIAIYLLLDVLGLRKFTSVLSGTLPATGYSFFEAKCMAALYLSFYLFAYLLAPIYFISGAILALLGARASRSSR